ncbi:MAG: hypothetical protein V3V08_21830 [Nannocystaceae bacterium]
MREPDLSRFFGVWQLEPLCSRYEQGPPPSSAVYRLGPTQRGVTFHLYWTARVKRHQEVLFELSFDGAVEVDGAQVTMSFDGQKGLVSEAHRDGVLVARSVRLLEANGGLLAVARSGPVAGGGMFTNHSLYRRIESAAP